MVSSPLAHIRILQSSYRDTVASVGVLVSPALPFTNSNSTIKTFRHALSLDEVCLPASDFKRADSYALQHRAEFRPNLYHRPSPTPIGSLVPETAGPTDPEASPSPNSMQSDKVRLVSAKPRRFMSLFKKPLKLLIDALEDEGPPTDLLEVWFAGCHAGTYSTQFAYLHTIADLCEDLRRRRIRRTRLTDPCIVEY